MAIRCVFRAAPSVASPGNNGTFSHSGNFGISDAVIRETLHFSKERAGRAPFLRSKIAFFAFYTDADLLNRVKWLQEMIRRT
ncbi:hypothetical protein D3C72_1148860 [compost metagenome]